MSHRTPPRLLDLFSGAGGCSTGYHRAGFDVVGVDTAPQPNYPFELHQADALEYLAQHGHKFDAIAASPPCQRYAKVTKATGHADQHPDLIGHTRELLTATGRPWVIENVPEAAHLGLLRADYLLCGSMFGLRIRRHRAFETSWRAHQMTAPCTHHRGLLPFIHEAERAYADAMGCTWMTKFEGRQAIPPAYTQHIGHDLLNHLTTEQAA